MTGIELAIVVGVVAFVVVGAISVAGLVTERLIKAIRRNRVPFELTDIALQASRPRVLVGQNCDIRFYFTVTNPRGLQLTYDARVQVAEIADVPPQQNTFAHQHFRTEVPRLHCKWSSVGTKRVAAFVRVQGNRKGMTAFVEGAVEVVAELEEE